MRILILVIRIIRAFSRGSRGGQDVRYEKLKGFEFICGDL